MRPTRSSSQTTLSRAMRVWILSFFVMSPQEKSSVRGLDDGAEVGGLAAGRSVGVD